MDIFRPELWHDFFLMVGGGAAALAGLVFVAISVNLQVITQDATHKNRAIGTLTGFSAVFMICAFALIGNQNYQVIGVEWFIVMAIAFWIYIRGIIRAKVSDGSRLGMQTGRHLFGYAMYAGQLMGSVIFIFGHIAGLYVASIAMVASFASMISGAWLLIIGIHQNKN